MKVKHTQLNKTDSRETVTLLKKQGKKSAHNHSIHCQKNKLYVKKSFFYNDNYLTL